MTYYDNSSLIETVTEYTPEQIGGLHQGPKRGRRKNVGAVDTSNGNMAFVAGYCAHGDKILLTPTELEELINSTYLRSKDIPQRMFIYLHRHFSTD